jgi:hypothetical protein
MEIVKKKIGEAVNCVVGAGEKGLDRTLHRLFVSRRHVAERDLWPRVRCLESTMHVLLAERHASRGRRV